MANSTSNLLRLHVAYDGSSYHGWQTQPDVRTVEGELTRAAAQILAEPAEEVKVQGASRTDAGVHAFGQVAHLVCDKERSLWEFVRGLNALTPNDICVNRVEPAAQGFHARHSAGGKVYRYEIWKHRFDHPFKRRRTWRIAYHLDTDRMRRAAERMVGTHDFEAFRAADCASPTSERTMRRVDIEEDDRYVTITVEGDAFLKYMVRVMVGTLVEIGAGQSPPTLIDDLFASGNRHHAGVTAPARGLTLLQVHYPDFPWQSEPPSIGGQYLPGE